MLRLRTLGDHLIDHAILLGLIRGHVVVAFSVAFNFVQRLTGALSQNLVKLLTRFQDFARGNFDLGCLTPDFRLRVGGS